VTGTFARDRSGAARSHAQGAADAPDGALFPRLPRKRAILPQFADTARAVPVKVQGLIETRAERVFRVEVGK
jgi:hypothetical protein